jgi:hypothetical protein
LRELPLKAHRIRTVAERGRREADDNAAPIRDPLQPLELSIAFRREGVMQSWSVPSSRWNQDTAERQVAKERRA